MKTTLRVDVQSQQGLFLPAERLNSFFCREVPNRTDNLARLVKDTLYDDISSLVSIQRDLLLRTSERAIKGLEEKGLLDSVYQVHGIDDYGVWDLNVLVGL